MEVVEDPLEPPRFKGKKVPRGPPSPPPPVLRSPPRKVTAQEQKEWMIPPCVSNWKNNKGYTIPLDKRLAADGRGLQDVRGLLYVCSVCLALSGDNTDLCDCRRTHRSTSTTALRSSPRRSTSPTATRAKKFASAR